MNAWAMRVLVMCVIASCIGAPRSSRVPLRLEPADRAFREGKLDEGLRLFAVARPEVPPAAASDFIAKHEKLLLAEIEAREQRGESGAAYVLVYQVSSTFESQAARKRLADLGARWTAALAKAIEKHEQAKHPATAMLLRATRAAVTRDRGDADAARTAYVELTGKHKLAVDARGEAARLAGVLARDRRFGDGGERVQLTLKLGAPAGKKDVKKQTKTAQVEQGTRAVENPARAQLEDRVADHEDRIANLREQKQAEQESPSRSQSSLEAFDYQIKVEQENLDEARADLRATPATIQEPNLVDYRYEVEVHTLAVTRDVELEVKLASGQPLTLRETVRVVKEDTAHTAHPQIRLAKKTASLPDERAVMPELDRAVDTWSAKAGDKIYDAYRARVLAALGDRGEGLALVIALGATDSAQVGELEKLLGIPRPDRVIAALERDQLATAFAPSAAAPVVAATPATKPAQTSTRPTTTTTPAATAAATKPAAPADEALRAKAGRAIAIAAFEVRRGMTVIAAVDRDGKILVRGKVTSSWRASDGVLEDASGRAILAVDKRGTVWIDDKGVKQVARLQGTTLVLDSGVTLAIDGGGYILLTRGKEREMSHETIRPASKQEMALIVAMLLSSQLRFSKR